MLCSLLILLNANNSLLTILKCLFLLPKSLFVIFQSHLLFLCLYLARRKMDRQVTAGNRGHQVTYTAILECREGEGPTQVEQGGGVLCCSLPLSRHRLAVSFGGRSSSVEAGARAGAKVKEWRPERGEPISEREVIFFFFSRRVKSTSRKNTGRKRRSRMLSA